MSYWSLCWELQNLGGMEKPKSSLADRTDGRLEVTWALVLLKCSLLRGWKEHKTESVRVSVQGLPMCCKRSIKVCPCGVSVAAWQSPQAFGTCMEPRPVWKSSHAGRMWSSTGARPHPVLCWAGRWLSQGGPLFLSTWAAGEEKVVCGGGGAVGERECLLWEPLSLYPRLPASSSGERTWSNSPVASASRSCLWSSCGSVSVSRARRAGCPGGSAGWPGREIKSARQRNCRCESEVSFLVL